MPLSAIVAQAHRTRELIEALLAEPRQLGPDYEPICTLAGTVVGFKATGRGAPGTDLADTLTLLDGARSLGLVERVDWTFRALAVEDMLTRPDVELHLTPEPETFGAPCAPRFAALMARANRELHIAAEIHADAFNPGISLAAGLADIRRNGWQIVLTDVADDSTALANIEQVEPDIVQLDLRLPGRTDRGHAGVQRLLAAAAKVGARVMALGVDTTTDRETAAGLGAVLARGASYGGPGPLPAP